MNLKALTAVIALCAMAGPALAQSVTSAPPPSENLSLLQTRVGELEQMLRQATSDNERLSIELRRARDDNARLQRQLTDAANAASQASAATTPDGALGTLPAEAGGPAPQLGEAMRLLQLGRFPDAEAAFTAYARANPQSPDTPEARYFIGRTQVAQRHFSDAADTFVTLLKDRPAIARAPDSWVMLGVSLQGMGKTPEACGVFHDLAVKYPRASAATRAQATAAARAAQCPAR